MRLLSVFALLDLPTVFGGHTGYESGVPRREGGDDGAGIGMASIVAVLLLILVTVGILVSLNPAGARAKLRSLAPAALMVVILAAPLGLWAASSGGDERSLIVERATTRTGAPEFIVYLGEDDLNTLETTRGKRAIRVECRNRDGRVVLDERQKWPFITERGYDYPHVHQAASREQFQRADSCRLRGTRVRLEAEVEGPLTG
ncbi:MAG: hypothetical protein ACRDLY_11060 [Thermoleophilaceae bacterium]